MCAVENFTAGEQSAIKELENRMKNKLTSSALKEDVYLYYRFLKARDFNVDKAEKMLLKHIKWRKIYQADTILETYKRKEVFVKCIEPNLLGFDKEGDIVRYSAAGRLNTAEIMKCFTMHGYLKHFIWFGEDNAALINQQSKKTGKMTYITIIMDLDKLDFESATSRKSADIYLQFAHLLQDNYPERMKAIYVINAPAYYVFVYAVVKAVMSNAMIRKIHVFGYNGWKEKLLEVIDADVLPVFLGGKRTDPDGDPYCRSFINFPEKVLESYYLPEDKRYFKDFAELNTLQIRPSEKSEIFVHVKETGSLIHWKFMVRNKTIAFGLFYEESQNVRKEILPMHMYDTSDGTEESFYKSSSPGKYIIIFDNTFSRFTAKEIQYIILVKKPEI